MDNIIKKVIEKLNEKTEIDEDDAPRFEDKSYKTFKIDKKNFQDRKYNLRKQDCIY